MNQCLPHSQTFAFVFSTMPTTATYTKIVQPPTITVPGRRRSSVRSSVGSSEDVSGISDHQGNNPVRRRNSALISLPNRFLEAIDGLPSTLEYEQISTTSISHENLERQQSGVFNVGDENRRYNFSTKPRPVSIGDYCHVLYKYPNYRSYLLSHICQHTGDWFVRIASILVVEELALDGETGEALACMALATKIPMAVLAPVGGVLADRFDRRTFMIIMDVLSGIVVLGYLLAIQFRNLSIFYVVTALRSALGASYFPVTTGIVPLMIPEPRDLQLAVTMNSWAWGTMAIVGGMVAGSLAAAIGLRTCYYIDCITFFISAIVIKCGVKGNFKVKRRSVSSATMAKRSWEDDKTAVPQPAGTPTLERDDTTKTSLHSRPQQRSKNPFHDAYHVICELAVYLFTCSFGMMVFLKSSASFVWGIEDIVGAEFSTVYNNDGTEDEELSSLHMGMLFSVVGAGCMAGPAIVNLITDANRPYTLQRACLFGVFFLTGGWLMISLTHTFSQFLAGTFYRTMGSGTVWVYSTLVLQTLTDEEILGRVLAVEFTMTQLFEAASASATGRLDEAGLTKNQLALFGALLGVIMLFFWGTCYFCSLGAANPRFNNNYMFDVNGIVDDEPMDVSKQDEIELGGMSEIDHHDNVGTKVEKKIAFV